MKPRTANLLAEYVAARPKPEIPDIEEIATIWPFARLIMLGRNTRVAWRRKWKFLVVILTAVLFIIHRNVFPNYLLFA